jgi:hypothetical protein
LKINVGTLENFVLVGGMRYFGLCGFHILWQ